MSLPPAAFRKSCAPLLLLLALALALPASAGAPDPGPPNVLLLTIDTLRSDRMSSYGYERPTTPNLDRLVHAGARFTRARTIEPLTAPALCSMLTGVYPHRHGASRNGLRMRAGLASLPKTLQGAGYRTAAFVGNWTLRDKLSGLGEHFGSYEEILTRRRWFGLLRSEATAEDLTEAALAWIDEHRRTHPGHPFFLWVHYVEPHAPYRLHDEFLDDLGLARDGTLGPDDRYDTEIAFVDHSIGELVSGFDARGIGDRTLVVFTADHGESLGEHDYWGHGRNLYEPTLRIPLAVTWPGRVRPQVVEAPALIVDVPVTVLGLLDNATPAGLEGYDWTPVLGGAPPPASRVTRYEAHRGAVISRHDSDLARRSGLLSVGVVRDERKEIFRIDKNRHEVFDLTADPGERSDLSPGRSSPSEELMSWMRLVYDGLTAFDDVPPEPLDEESAEQLRSLGYVD